MNTIKDILKQIVIGMIVTLLILFLGFILSKLPTFVLIIIIMMALFYLVGGEIIR